MLPDLVWIAGGDPRRVLTISDFVDAELGVYDGFGEDQTLRYDVLGDFARPAADGRFTIPIARIFPLQDWRVVLDISLTGNARGKLLLLPGNPAAVAWPPGPTPPRRQRSDSAVTAACWASITDRSSSSR